MKRIRFRSSMVLGVLLATAGTALGQDLDLATVERRALAEAPALVALRAAVEAEQALARSAGVLDDPMLEVDAMDLVPGGGRPLEALAIVRQPLPAPGRRAAERAVAAARVEVAKAELAAAERSLVGELRRGWAEIWALAEERRLLEEAHPLVELMVESATARVAGGGESVRAVLEARVALRRHEGEQEEVDARWFAAQSRLSQLAGFAEGALFPRVGALPELPSPEPELVAAAESSVRVAVARARVELARAELAAVRTELRPGFSVGAGVRAMEGDGAELVLGGGIELPIFRRARVTPKIEAAEAALRGADAEAAGERTAVRGELERLYLERIRIERQLERLRQALLPESEAAFEAARVELLDGRGGVAMATALLEQWVGVKIDESRLLAERFATRAAIGALVDTKATEGERP